MRPTSWLRRSTALIRPTITGCVLAGAIIFVTLLHEWSTVTLSRTAILLQAVAIVLVVLYQLWQRTRRLLLYPIVLACLIYLWDATLPPPHLPDGLARSLIPLATIGTMVADLSVMLWRQRRSKSQRAEREEYVDIRTVAALLGVPVEQVRTLLRTNPAPVRSNGHHPALLASTVALAPGAQRPTPGVNGARPFLKAGLRLQPTPVDDRHRALMTHGSGGYTLREALWVSAWFVVPLIIVSLALMGVAMVLAR